MIDTRWVKILSDLLTGKTRTLLIVLSIAVGLFAVGTIVSARATLATDMDQAFAEINPSTGIVRTLEVFEEDFIQGFRAVKGVKDVDARRTIFARVQVEDGEWFDFKLFAVPDYDAIRVNKIRPVSDSWPPPDRAILIERSAVALLDLKPGQSVTIELGNEKKRTLPVAGIVHDLIQVPAQFDQTPYGYISFNTVDWLGEPYGFNELQVVVDPGLDAEEAREVINRVKDRAEKNGYTIPLSMTAEPGALPLNDILDAILMLMGALGGLALLLSIFLIINTISALLAQQKRQIGVMKALGASSFQLVSMYLVMVIIYGLAALALAMPLSLVGAQALSQVLAEMFNFDLGRMNTPPEAILIQLLTGLLIPVAASLYPFMTSLRVSAAEAMRANGGASKRKNWFDRLLAGEMAWAGRRVLLRPLLLSLRNTFRSQGRLALTLITLTLAGAIFISVFSIRSSLMSTLEALMKMWNFDIMVNFSQPYRGEKIRQFAFELPEVADADSWMQQPSRRIRPDGSESELIYMFAPNAGSRLAVSPEMIDGRWLVPGDENSLVVNTIFMKKEADARIGGEVVLKINGKKHSFRIVGVCMGFSVSMIYGNYPYLTRLTNQIDQATTILISTRNPGRENVDRLASELEAHFKRRGLRIANVQTIDGERSEMEGNFNILVVFLMVMAFLLALVGGLGLMGTMSINVLERTREIGVLRALGAPNRGVAQVFILEGVAIGVMSWGLGALLALPLGKPLSDMVGIPLLGTSLQYSYAVEAVWLWLVLVVVLSALASLLPARSAARLTVREVLAYE